MVMDRPEQIEPLCLLLVAGRLGISLRLPFDGGPRRVDKPRPGNLDPQADAGVRETVAATYRLHLQPEDRRNGFPRVEISRGLLAGDLTALYHFRIMSRTSVPLHHRRGGQGRGVHAAILSTA
ncbi:MAG TPA: hypothetical protein VGX37_03020 [Allosphingosinicella sp.]|jgi:hypothetical protein|nr:hypothetical protein [Allosphingosinicella sp.]